MSFLSRIARKPFDLIEHQIDKLKSQVKAEVAEAVSKLALVFVMVIMLCFGVLFASIALSIYLNSIMRSDIFGFLIASVIYVGIFLILFFARNKDTIFQKAKEFSKYLFGNNKLP